MPRKIVPTQSDFPYFVGGRCINRQWFDIPIAEVWDVMGSQLFFMHHAFNVVIHSFVLMSNHYHAIITAPHANLSEAMSFFMRETSREIVRRAGRINQAWGAPYYRCILKTNSHFLNAYKYTYRNPVAAGISESCEGYRFSTLHGLLGMDHMIIRVVEDTLLFRPDLDLSHLHWLNTAKQEDELEVHKALTKAEFSFLKRNKYSVRPDDFIF